MSKNERAFLGEAAGPMPLDIARPCLKIRELLGSRAGLLDEYLSVTAQRLSAVDQGRIVGLGVMAFERLCDLCRNLLEGGVPMEPLEHRAADLIAKYLVPVQPVSVPADMIRAEIYALLLAGEHYPLAAAEASADIFDDMETAAPSDALRHLREELASACGSKSMDALDKAILSAWQPATPLQLFRQGYVGEMLELISQGNEAPQKANTTLLFDALDSLWENKARYALINRPLAIPRHEDKPLSGL